MRDTKIITANRRIRIDNQQQQTSAKLFLLLITILNTRLIILYDHLNQQHFPFCINHSNINLVHDNIFISAFSIIPLVETTDEGLEWKKT